MVRQPEKHIPEKKKRSPSSIYFAKLLQFSGNVYESTLAVLSRESETECFFL